MAAIIGLAAFIVVPRLEAEPDLSFESGVSLALRQGLVPVADHPQVGTEIYQWDPGIEACAPSLIGTVTDGNVRSPRGPLVRIKSRNKFLDGGCLNIVPREMRYWIMDKKGPGGAPLGPSPRMGRGQVPRVSRSIRRVRIA